MSKFHRLFRLSQREIWQDLAEKINADFIPGKPFRSTDAVQAYHENWTIILDTYQVPKGPAVTRIRAPYLNRDSFHFRIMRENASTWIGKRVGMQDVVIGYPEFDEDFVIQGNDEVKLRQLFDNDLIRSLIHFQPQMSLKVILDDSYKTDEFGEGFSELIFEVPAVIKNIELLHALYDLFAEILNHLCHIGSAYENDPFLKR
jgi:hypothetical protein